MGREPHLDRVSPPRPGFLVLDDDLEAGPVHRKTGKLGRDDLAESARGGAAPVRDLFAERGEPFVEHREALAQPVDPLGTAVELDETLGRGARPREDRVDVGAEAAREPTELGAATRPARAGRGRPGTSWA